MSHIKYKVVPIDKVPPNVRYAPFETQESARALVDLSGGIEGPKVIERLLWENVYPPSSEAKFAIIDRTLDEIERMYKELCLESD